MLQNFKSKPKHIKLDRQDGMPSVKMLEEMKMQAKANAGATVELPFGVESLIQILTVSRDSVKGSWLWMLYVDEGFGSRMDWSHISNDVTYIHALIGSSHPEFLSKRPTQKSTVAEEQQPKMRKGTLEGNLRNIQIANLLQSINMGQMTGRLEIISGNDKATILFSNGDAVYASMRGADGHEAVLQLFIWEDGSFAFYDEPAPATPNITRGLTGLIMEGATFADHHILIKERGLTHQCYPHRVVEIASQEELSALVKNSVDCDKVLQWNIYQKITGNSSWAEIVRDFPARKTEWVPAMFNLVSCGIIRFENAAIGAPKSTTRNVDWSIVQTVKNSMCRADTGLYTFAALLYSLEQEFCRYEGFELPFSILVFGFCLKPAEGEKPGAPQFIPIKSTAVIELRNKIVSIQKKYDLLCHYGAFAYAMLLPLTLKQNAGQFADILAELCSGMNVTDEYDISAIEFRAATANIPEDCQSLDELLTLAEKVRGLSG